jgi:hypothetical protein
MFRVFVRNFKGARAVDVLSKQEGWIAGRTDCINGCNRYCLEVASGKWFGLDEERLQLVNTMHVAKLDTPANFKHRLGARVRDILRDNTEGIVVGRTQLAGGARTYDVQREALATELEEPVTISEARVAVVEGHHFIDMASKGRSAAERGGPAKFVPALE